MAKQRDIEALEMGPVRQPEQSESRCIECNDAEMDSVCPGGDHSPSCGDSGTAHLEHPDKYASLPVFGRRGRCPLVSSATVSQPDHEYTK